MAQNCWIFGAARRSDEAEGRREEETKRQREEERKDRFFEPLMFMNLIH